VHCAGYNDDMERSTATRILEELNAIPSGTDSLQVMSGGICGRGEPVLALELQRIIARPSRYILSTISKYGYLWKYLEENPEQIRLLLLHKLLAMLAVDDEPACSALIEEISEGSKAHFIYQTDFSSACCRWNAAKCLTKYLRKGRHCFSNAAPDPTDVAFMSIHLRDACEYNNKYMLDVTVQCSGRVPPQRILSALCFHCITKDFMDVLCKE
jgi:hypothetical protein